MSTLLICYNWRTRCPQSVNILDLEGFLSVKGIIYSIFCGGGGGGGRKTLLSRKTFALFSFSYLFASCRIPSASCVVCSAVVLPF